MDSGVKWIAFGIIFCGVFEVCHSTSCTAQTGSTCTPTLYVTGTCNTQTNQCECVNGYSPVVTGCAATDAVLSNERKAVITAGDNGELSGWFRVADSPTMTLTCNAPSVSGSNVYRWYLDNVEVSGSNGATLVLSGLAEQTYSYSCSVPSGIITYAKSEPFVVQGYSDTATIGGQPVVTGMPDKHFDGASVNLRCGNIPMDSRLKVKWGTLQAVANPTRTFLFIVASTETKSCELVLEGASNQFQNAQSADVTSILVVPTQLNLELKIAEGPTLTVSRGQTHHLTCQLNETVAYASTQDTDTNYYDYQWKRDGQVIEDCSLCTNEAPNVLVFKLADTQPLVTIEFTCLINVKGRTSQVGSAPVEVTVEDDVSSMTDSKVTDVDLVNLYPFAPTGGYTELRCLVTAENTDGITFAWTFDSTTIIGQTDRSLQLNDLSASDEGEYTCSVTSGGATLSSSSLTISVSSFSYAPSFSPVFGVTYLIGKTYTVNCYNLQHTPGVTYQWFIGDDKQADGNTYQFTAPTASTALKCKTTFQSTTTESILTIAVEVLEKPTISGPTLPVLGSTATYTCQTELSPRAPAPTYKWFADGNEITGQTTATLTLNNINGEDHARAYSCEVTSGSAVQTSTGTNLSPAAVPQTPVVTSPTDVFHRAGTYTLKCTSNSFVPAAQIQWIFKSATSGSTSQSLPSTNCALLISPADRASAGDYSCRMTINGKQSQQSAVKSMPYLDIEGKDCTSTSDCTGAITPFWFNTYTGNCLSGVCECAHGVTATTDQCGEATTSDDDSSTCLLEDGAQSLVPSIVSVCLAVFCYFATLQWT